MPTNPSLLPSNANENLLATLFFLPLQVLNAQDPRSFPPFLGCDDGYVNGIPSSDDECYAVDSFLCRWQFDTGCREEIATYYYYIGGNDDYPYEEYHTVDIIARSMCNETAQEPMNSCRISVDQVDCNSCSNEGADYRVVRLRDCTNLPGVVFPRQPQRIVVKDGEGHFGLAYNETRCNHPFFHNNMSETTMPSNTIVPSLGATTSTTTMNPTDLLSFTNPPTSRQGTSAPIPPQLRGAQDELNTVKKKTLAVYPKFKFSFSDTTIIPDMISVESLLQYTHHFFGNLLHNKIPQLQDLGMSQVSAGTTDDHTTSNFWLNFTAQATMDLTAPCTTRQLALYFTNHQSLKQYRMDVVQQLFSFPHSESVRVRAYVTGTGYAVAPERDY